MIRLDESALIDLLNILAPQLSYKRPSSRDDGFVSRVERAFAIVQRGGLERLHERENDVHWAIPSWRFPGAKYDVWLDGDTGEHQCSCHDRAFCCHRLAAGIAEQQYRAANRVETITRKRARRQWDRQVSRAYSDEELATDKVLMGYES